MTTVTVVADDRRIIVDGEVLTFTFPIASEIWAVQWDGTKGHIEYRDGRMPKALTSQSEVSAYISAHAAEKQRAYREQEEKVEAAEYARLRDPGARKAEVEQLRIYHSGKDMPWTFPGAEDVDYVQLRVGTEDRENIHLLYSGAIAYRLAGVTDPVMEFRALSDITYYLTPEQMIEMGMAALGRGSLMYKHAWGLKAEIDSLAFDPEALAALNLGQGWPE